MTQPKDGEGAEALLAQIDVMRKALEPFAKAAEWANERAAKRGPPASTTAIQLWWSNACYGTTADDFRRAAEALAPPATPVRGGGGQGSSNASRAAMGPSAHSAPEAEPSAAGEP